MRANAERLSYEKRFVARHALLMLKKACSFSGEAGDVSMHAKCAPIDKKKITIAAIAIFVALLLIATTIALVTCGKSDDSAKSEDAKQVGATTEQPANDKSDAQSSGQKTTQGTNSQSPVGQSRSGGSGSAAAGIGSGGGADDGSADNVVDFGSIAGGNGGASDSRNDQPAAEGSGDGNASGGNGESDNSNSSNSGNGGVGSSDKPSSEGGVWTGYY